MPVGPRLHSSSLQRAILRVVAKAKKNGRLESMNQAAGLALSLVGV
jgi:hypothetical protein